MTLTDLERPFHASHAICAVAELLASSVFVDFLCIFTHAADSAGNFLAVQHTLCFPSNIIEVNK